MDHSHKQSRGSLLDVSSHRSPYCSAACNRDESFDTPVWWSISILSSIPMGDYIRLQNLKHESVFTCLEYMSKPFVSSNSDFGTKLTHTNTVRLYVQIDVCIYRLHMYRYMYTGCMKMLVWSRHTYLPTKLKMLMLKCFQPWVWRKVQNWQNRKSPLVVM